MAQGLAGTVDLVLPLIIALNDHLSIMHTRARMSAKLRFKLPRIKSFVVWPIWSR